MNKDLQKYMNTRYRGSIQPPVEQRGDSSLNVTVELRRNLLAMFNRYNIKSVFDSGCNDSQWGSTFSQRIEYQGGDIAMGLVAEAWCINPDKNIIVHDCTTDLYPKVDCVFIRDVTIHLTTEDQQRFFKNWLDSDIPWLVISHNPGIKVNTDLKYVTETLNARETNWCIAPWNWPLPTDVVLEPVAKTADGRQMGLWHRDQLI